MSLVHSTHDKTLLFFGPGLKEIAAVSPDIGNEALGPTIALTVLATMVVGLRCWTRVYIVKGLGVDDYVILVSLVSCALVFSSGVWEEGGKGVVRREGGCEGKREKGKADGEIDDDVGHLWACLRW